MTAGWPDLEVLADDGPFFIEFKTAKGRQSPEQKAVQEALEAAGYKYYIVRSVEEFAEICHRHLGPERDPDLETLRKILGK